MKYYNGSLKASHKLYVIKHVKQYQLKGTCAFIKEMFKRIQFNDPVIYYI
ncbi:hypothetical protein HanXRQr2_Chr06g0247201 [Helianthus annuus]|uniref:Uncharacterized protein n=1 Tax=Helianthus annuus TaxID=4232 RepID=A0A9K3IQT0_HELAN|nr:hypothetical protein HanXRQr2_Chr06g0247201 [Helianthus annuus]